MVTSNVGCSAVYESYRSGLEHGCLYVRLGAHACTYTSQRKLSFTNYLILGPGIALCNYYGAARKDCKYQGVSIDELPECCTSFVWEKIFVSTSYDVFQENLDSDSGKLDVFLV